MEFDVLQFIIVGTLIVGASITSFNIGIRQGAGAMFEHLFESGTKEEDGSRTISLKK